MSTQKQSILSTDTLFEIINIVKKNYKRIATVVTAVTIFTGIIVFSLPRTYSSTTTMLPETSNSLSLPGNLGSLSSMIGLKTQMSDDAIYPEVYPKIISSSRFIVNLFNKEIKLPSSNETVTLYDYFDKYQKSPWWAFFVSIFSKKEDTITDLHKINPEQLTKKEEKIASSIDNAILCLVDKKTDLITITITVQHPEIAKQIADLVKDQLQVYITNYRTNKARIDYEYYTKLTEEAKREYEKTRQIYGSYAEANSKVVLESVRLKAEDLENKMQLQFNIYSQLVAQQQGANAKIQERTPAFTTIQPAIVPLKPSGPKRMICMAMTIILSFMGCIFWYLTKERIKK